MQRSILGTYRIQIVDLFESSLVFRSPDHHNLDKVTVLLILEAGCFLTRADGTPDNGILRLRIKLNLVFQIFLALKEFHITTAAYKDA